MADAAIAFRQTMMIQGVILTIDVLTDWTLAVRIASPTANTTIILPNEEFVLGMMRMVQEGYRFAERSKPR